MIYAFEINAWTLDLITELNEGVRPGAATLKKPTYFIWSSDKNVPNQIITEAEYRNEFGFREMPDINVVEAI